MHSAAFYPTNWGNFCDKSATSVLGAKIAPKFAEQKLLLPLKLPQKGSF